LRHIHLTKHLNPIFIINTVQKIVYGTSDGGNVIHEGNEVKSILNEISSAFHLVIHPVREYSTKEVKLLELASDFEIHIGSDHKYYALDFARLILPNHPFTNLFRYEYLSELEKENISLSSDIFSGLA